MYLQAFKWANSVVMSQKHLRFYTTGHHPWFHCRIPVFIKIWNLFGISLNLHPTCCHHMCALCGWTLLPCCWWDLTPSHGEWLWYRQPAETQVHNVEAVWLPKQKASKNTWLNTRFVIGVGLTSWTRLDKKWTFLCVLEQQWVFACLSQRFVLFSVLFLLEGRM